MIIRLLGAAAICAALFSAVTIRASQADSRAVLEKADVLVRAGRFDEAEQQARLVLGDPAFQPVAYAVLGAVRLEQRRYKESIEFLNRAIQLQPKLIGARLNLAQAYMLSGRAGPAMETYKQVLALDTTNATARFELANEQLSKGNYRSSLDLARPVVAASSTAPPNSAIVRPMDIGPLSWRSIPECRGVRYHALA